MALWRAITARQDATRGTLAVEHRRWWERMLVRPGIMPRSTPTLVTGTAGWAYQVDIAGFVSQNGPADGFHVFGNDGAVVVGEAGVGGTVPAKPGGGLSRIDIIWVKHPSSGDLGATDSVPTFGVTVGGAASSPTAPAIPTGALELGRNLMTSAATSTASAGNTIETTVLWTGPHGGFTVVRTHAGDRSLMPGSSLQRPVLVWCVTHLRFEVAAGGDYMDLSVGVSTGREPFTVTTAVPTATALTGLITIPALPVPTRVVVVAQGRTGGNGGTRRVAYYFDGIPGGTTATQDPADADTHALAPTNARTTVVSTLMVDAPANTPITFRVRVSSPDGDVFSTGAAVWTRTPQPVA